MGKSIHPTNLPVALESLLLDGQPSEPKVQFRWMMLRKSGRPFLLLPASFRQARQGLDLYPAQRLLARACKWSIPLLAGTPLSRLLPEVVLDVPVSGELLGFLARIQGQPPQEMPAPSILCGNHPPDRQRFIILPSRCRGCPPGIVKAAHGQAARELVRHEATFLSKLPSNIPGIVRMQGQFSGASLEALALAYCPGGVPRTPDKLPHFLRAWLHAGESRTVASLGPWNKLAAAASEHPLMPALTREVALCPVRTAVCHGDFIPGNIRVSPSGEWTAIDWENGELHGLPGWDWFHYIAQVSILIQRHSPGTTADVLDQLLASPDFCSYAASAGIQDITRPLLLAYLLKQITVVRPSEGLEATMHVMELLAGRWSRTLRSR